jgi:hypothetical protein
MTEKRLASIRANGRKSHGAVTPEGKARVAQINLRHGFYSQADQEVLMALGEDPAEYVRMMKSLETDLAQAMEEQVVGCIGRTFWRMKRAERIQDGLAVKRVRKGTEIEEFMAAPQMLHIYGLYENLCALGRRINNPDPMPSRDEIEALIDAVGAEPPDAVKAVFPLYRAYWEAVWKAPTPAAGEGNPSPAAEAAQRETEAALEKLNAVLDPLCMHYCQANDMGLEKLDLVKSPENVAALMAPKDQNALLMQRMEDSNLRQLWRLTNILMKVRRGGLDLNDLTPKGTSQ